MKLINDNRKKLPPKAADVFGGGWDIMWKVFPELLVVSLVFGLISGPVAFNWEADHFSWFLFPVVLMGMAYGIFIVGPIGYSVDWVHLKAVRREQLEIRDMFAVFQRNYWNALIGRVLVSIIIGLGFLILIVPGIIFACRLAFVPYLIIDRKMDVMEALGKSWEMTKGYGWQIFFMGIIAFFVVILGLMALFVGVIISIIWIRNAFALMYLSVVDRDDPFNEGPDVIEEHP